MSQKSEAFIAYLQGLSQRQDRRALAILRRSLAHDPGAYYSAFPYVEPFVANDVHELDARRLALYAVAGLYALHPTQNEQSLSSALGVLWHRKDHSAALEQRFIALLEADSNSIVTMLRHTVSLLAAEELGCDYQRLLLDLTQLMNPLAPPGVQDRIRQSWARDFYRMAKE